MKFEKQYCVRIPKKPLLCLIIALLLCFIVHNRCYSHANQRSGGNISTEESQFKDSKDNVIIYNQTCVIINKDDSTLSQKVFTKENTIYVINCHFTLIEDIVVPKNCVLKFDNGSFGGSKTITGQNTTIVASNTEIFKNGILIEGTWKNSRSFSHWFDFSKDGSSDDTRKYQNLLNFRGEIEIEPDITINIGSILFPSDNTNANTSCRIHSNTTIFGNNATLKLADGFLLSNNTNVIWSDRNVENVKFYDLCFEGNSKNNKFTSNSPTRTSYFIYIDGGKDVVIERCKFLNTPGRNCIVLQRNSDGDYYNARIRDCFFKNGGAYLSDGTFNSNQNDISFFYTEFENTVVEKCTFINCDLDTEESIDGVSYETRLGYLRNTGWGNGGVELHASNCRCLENTFLGCDIGVYLALNSKISQISNLDVSNNYIEKCSLGINIYPNTNCDTINILNNRIRLIATNASQQMGIGVSNQPSTFYLKNAQIANNDIACIEASSTACLIKLFIGENITVTNNRLLASTNEHAISIVDYRANYSGLKHATFKNISITDNIITFDVASPKMSAINCDYSLFNGSSAENRCISDVSVCDNVIIFNGENITSTGNTVFNGLQIFNNTYRRPHVSNITYARNKIKKNGVRLIVGDKFDNSNRLFKDFHFTVHNNVQY